MFKFKLETPVVFIIFNRPDTTEKVFESIRQAQPSKLFIIADGPRQGKEGEAEKCYLTRAVINRVDWECEVMTNYSDINLGCKKRVISGLNWVFSQVEEAIILEDDTLPNISFFQFASELLEYFRFNKKVMAIGGTNPLQLWKEDQQDYHFSYQGSIWGWATWRRAWKLYDPLLKGWQTKEVEDIIRRLSIENKFFNCRKKIFCKVKSNKIDTWDYQWLFSRLINEALTVIPSKNLVSNIGFGVNATHTKDSSSKLSNLINYSAQFPINHPNEIIIDEIYEKKALDFIFNLPSENIVEKLIKIFSNSKSQK